MKVTLMNYTANAVDMLLFAKSTRLGLNETTMDSIAVMNTKDRQNELAYIANTVPSSWEFVDYTFLLQGVSRAFTHQLVRTRTGSYAQETLRIVDKLGGYDFVHTAKNLQYTDAFNIIKEHTRVTQQMYEELVEVGQPPEDARGILPTNIATNIMCKFNLRTFADLVITRIGGRTQGEYKDVLEQMVACVLEVPPWAEPFLFNGDRNYFDDIEAFAEQEFGDDLSKKGQLLKIVDKMRKAK